MSVAKPREDRATLAVILCLVTFFLFTCMDTTARYLNLAGYAALQIAFLRYTVAFVLAIAVFLPREGRDLFRTERLWVQGLRGLLLLGSTALNFSALGYLPLAVTISIFLSSPIFVVVLSIPVLGEKVGPRRLAAVLFGFVGVLIITRPWSADFHPAMFLSLGSTLCTAGYFLLTRAVAGSDTNATSQFYAAGIATFALAPFGIAQWQWPSEPLHYGLFALVGSFGLLGHSILTNAYRLAEASVLAPLVYSQIFFASFLGWLVFRDVPSVWTVVGAAVIVGSGLYIWLRERQLGRSGRTSRTLR